LVFRFDGDDVVVIESLEGALNDLLRERVAVREVELAERWTRANGGNQDG
jgi:hypothetical protein